MNNIMGFSSPVSSIGRIYTPFSGRSITDMLRSGVTGDIGTKIFSVTWDGEREVLLLWEELRYFQWRITENEGSCTF